MLKQLRADLESNDPFLRLEALRKLIDDKGIKDNVKKLILKELIESEIDFELCEKARKYYELLVKRDIKDEEEEDKLESGTDAEAILSGDDSEKKISFLKAVGDDREVLTRKLLVNRLVCETDPRVVAHMLDCLGHIGKKKDARIIIDFLKDRVSLVRASAVKALDALNNEMTFNRIILMLQDADQSVVANADHFIQSLGESRLKDLLEKMVNSSKRYNLEGAIFVLHRTDSDWAKELLEKALKRKKDLET